jgi:hypothetical protein
MRVCEIAATRVRYGYIKGFMFCFDARAGASTTSGYIGSMGRKGLIYAGRDLVVMSQAAGG